ncbi:DUF6365 family protein [Erythrobacter sp. JK5]|uniref:DUF6365 family protein n=1 Tax=Erythrobacter sp. JK5 TaxID=2829500 RepID=UPI001BA952EF|nr:DUF6365 family protein [Erythrobacter sp. JK5]QUL37959.1 hypothetical protein KDC96_00535 [Erythrobacter sp. JK5]
MSGRILFLCLTPKGLGETRHAVELASQLRAAGHTTHFLAHECATKVLQDAAQPATIIPDHVLPMMQFFLSGSVRNFRPDAIVLGDWFTTTLALERSGQEFAAVFGGFDVPIYAIDTWCSARAGHVIDLYGTTRRPFPDWRPDFAGRLEPVPMGTGSSDAVPFSVVPEPLKLARKVRRHIRRDLNADDRRIVLVCTAGWQHAHYEDESARRLQQALPRLIGLQLRAFGSDVALVHVGPEKLDFGLGRQQVWLPTMRPERFESLVASVDLLLTANVSASTNVRAIADGVPILVIGGSIRAATRDDMPPEFLHDADEGQREWLDASLPAFPFHLWPLGYRRFVDPVLADNPYTSALRFADYLDLAGMREQLGALLLDEATRADARADLAAYADWAHELPPVGRLPPARSRSEPLVADVLA